jgi:hypothetical protein
MKKIYNHFLCVGLCAVIFCTTILTVFLTKNQTVNSTTLTQVKTDITRKDFTLSQTFDHLPSSGDILQCLADDQEIPQNDIDQFEVNDIN